ncbi:glycosyltransferase family 9 protein [soil metagenome]
MLRALGLGDLLTVIPALRGIRAALPGHRVVLGTAEQWAPLVELIGGVDAVHPTQGLAPLQWSGPAPDLAINLHGRGPRSHAALIATGAETVVGFGRAGCPAWDDDEHEVRRWCRLVEAAVPVRCDPGDLDLAAPPVPSPWPAAVVVHPGAAFGSRQWPAGRFATVARALAGQGQRVVLTGSTEERPLAAGVADRAGLDPSHVLAGRTSILELAALVAQARLVISGDTGVAHVATAYRRPSVLLFGPTPPSLWGPPARPQHLVLWRGHGRGDPFAATVDPALLAIGAEEVLAATDALLAAGHGPAGG